MTARSERPIRREISWVRPPMRPLTDSRSERVLVAAGSIAYSAVTQPWPEPLRQRGTPSEADAAHSTLVPPNSISTEPAAWSSQLRVIVIGRSSSSARPSSRGVARGAVIGAEVMHDPSGRPTGHRWAGVADRHSHVVRRPGAGQLDRARPLGARLGLGVGAGRATAGCA